MSSEHDVLMRRHTMIKNHIDLNFVSGKNKLTDFSGHSCDRLVTCPGVPHLSPASAGISSSPEAGKQRDGWTAPTPSARISCRNFRSDELEPELRSTCTLVPSRRSIHVSRASFCSATSVCKRVKNRHQTIAANEREERHLLLAATLPLSSGHFMPRGTRANQSDDDVVILSVLQSTFS